MNFSKEQKLLQKLLLVAILLTAFALRVYNLENIPNGLFTDEAARGYDALSISRTGADMFDARFPVFLRGFDDYTAGLYVYLTVPLLFFLDLSRFSVRFPSAWIGVFTVAVSYLAIRRAFGRVAGLAGAALLAVSPWYVLLSRIGTEWNLLALGPMLTIVLAYRGLSRPKWLVAAGLTGGISLYGYAPAKAFLPLLMAGFTAFYWKELFRQKRSLVIAFGAFALLALPIYAFSFTAQGLIRFREVASVSNLSWQDSAYLFARNYFAYFHPRFLFITDPTWQDIFFVQRFKSVGLLYWFELPLIIVGLFRLFRFGKRERYFWLFWLLIAPVGINLHLHSPKPALWLTSTPTLHGLAGAGLMGLIYSFRRGFTPGQFKIRLQRGIAAIALAGLAIMAVINISAMLNDLFTKFPVYATATIDWGYGMKQGVKDLVRLQPAFDQANLDTFGVIDGIYVAFYTQYPPQQRQAEVAKYGE